MKTANNEGNTLMKMRLIPLMIGIMFLLISFLLYKQELNFIKKAKLTHGFVNNTAFKQEWLHRRHGTKKIIKNNAFVIFQDINGEWISYESKVTNFLLQLDIGEKVEIYYNPEKPYDARINSFWDTWFKVFAYAIFSLVPFFLMFKMK